MAQNGVTSFQSAAAVTARKLEVTAADFDAGCNNGASNSPGIGINIGGGAVVGSAAQFTLLDQHGAVREPQDGSHIGVDGLDDGAAGVGVVPIDTVTNNANGTGAVTKTGDANLETLANGWVDTAVVP